VGGGLDLNQARRGRNVNGISTFENYRLGQPKQMTRKKKREHVAELSKGEVFERDWKMSSTVTTALNCDLGSFKQIGERALKEIAIVCC